MEMDSVSLKEYFDSRIESICRKFTLEIRSIREAVEKSERLLQVRLEGLNEWRAQNKDIIAKFVTQNEIDLQIGRLDDRMRDLDESIRALELDRAKLAGKADQKSVNISYIFSAIGAIIAIISFLMSVLGG